LLEKTDDGRNLAPGCGVKVLLYSKSRPSWQLAAWISPSDRVLVSWHVEADIELFSYYSK